MDNLAFTASGYAIAVVLFFLLLNAKEDLGIAEEECNTRIAVSVAEAEKVAREATQSALERRLAQLEAMARDEREAASLANMAREDALREAESAQATIRRLIAEAGEDETAPIEQACLAISVPDAITDGLR
jgi:hypothetical protein